MAWGLALVMALAAGCAGAPPQAGPGDATLELAIKGKAPAELGPWQPTPDQINWDLGVYRLGPEGRLSLLRPLSGRKLTVITGNPFSLQDAFVLPPGPQRVRVILEAYFFRPAGDGNLPTSLVYHRKDLELDLKPGEKSSVELDFAGAP